MNNKYQLKTFCFSFFQQTISQVDSEPVLVSAGNGEGQSDVEKRDNDDDEGKKTCNVVDVKTFNVGDVDPRFIVTRPGKNMKLRKSRFRFGSFAFGQSAPVNPAPVLQLPAPTFSVSTDPYFGHDRLREESKFRLKSFKRFSIEVGKERAKQVDLVVDFKLLF